jgi:hypothetical protein
MVGKNKLATGVLEATRDRWGRLVVLTQTAMDHIAERHPEMDGCELAITTAIETATFRCDARKAGREVLYAANLGPTAWLAVVVAYGEHGGVVITAYGSKQGPQTGANR